MQSFPIYSSICLWWGQSPTTFIRRGIQRCGHLDGRNFYIWVRGQYYLLIFMIVICRNFNWVKELGVKILTFGVRPDFCAPSKLTKNRRFSRWPCWRPTRIKTIFAEKLLFSKEETFYCFVPPIWPLWSPFICSSYRHRNKKVRCTKFFSLGDQNQSKRFLILRYRWLMENCKTSLSYYGPWF